MNLVTGATGLVGSHLVCALLKQGAPVRAMKRHSSDMAWFEKVANVVLPKPHQEYKNLEWFNGDLRDSVDVFEAVLNCNRVYHSGALVSFKDSDQDLLMDINSKGTKHIVDACLSMEIFPELCYVSSTATVGRKKHGAIDEKDEFILDETVSHYAISKYRAELEAYRGREEGLNVAIINPCIILGFGNWLNGPGRFFKNAYEGFPFYTMGSNAFVDVRDVVGCCIRLMDEKHFTGKYLCTGFNETYLNLFSALADQFKSKKPKFKVTPAMAEIAWRLVLFFSWFGGKSVITRSSARSGSEKRTFSSLRLQGDLDYKFHSMSDCLEYHCEAFQKYFLTDERQTSKG